MLTKLVHKSFQFAALKTLFLFFLGIGTAEIAYAQTHLMSNGTVSTCSGTFYDSGGSASDYGNNENFTFTICPSTPGAFVSVDFDFLRIRNNDILSVYEGNTAGTLISSFTSINTTTNVIITSTHSTGCLTFVFTSNGSQTRSGWAAAISCVVPCQTVISSIVSSTPSPNLAGEIRTCQGVNVSLTGTGTYPQSGTGYVQSNATSTFLWSFGDGTTQSGVNLTTVNHTYPDGQGYLVQLTITDVNGCSNTNIVDQKVAVSTTPSFAGTVASSTNLCLGNSATITGAATPVTFTQDCAPASEDSLLLPDGVGVSYSTTSTLTCFAAGQTLTSAAQIDGICLNIEHSWVNDLSVSITCPTGQSVILDSFGGTGSQCFLGEPIDGDDASPIVGAGWDYCWSPSPTYGTWNAEAGNYVNDTLPSGSYATQNSLNGLIGCQLNGDWTLTITDNLASDNGFIFSFDVDLNIATAPPWTYTPSFTSTGWDANPTITNPGNNPINVLPTSAGVNGYTYTVTDDFGCSYDTLININVTAPPNAGTNGSISLCTSGSTVNLFSSLGGSPATTGTWSGPSSLSGGHLGTFNPATMSGGVYTYTVLGTAPCANASATVTVTLTTNPSAPTAATPQTFCAINNPTIASLVATGSSIQWFAAASGGTALASTAALVNGTTYYASQTVNGCVSTSRTSVAVTIGNPAAPTGSASQSFCAINNPTVANLSATGTAIQWYSLSTGGTALATTTALTTGTTYYASQTVSGCQSATRLAVAVTIGNPAAPTGSASQTFCAINNPTVANLSATGTAIQWYSVSTGGTALASTTALTTGTTYYASQTVSGCQSAARLAVAVTIGNPAAPTGSASQSFCAINNPTVANLSATGTAIQWYSVSTGGTALATTTALTTGTTYYASQTVSGCQSATRLAVAVTIGNPAAPTGSANQSFCAINNPTVANLSATGTAIQWYTTSTGGSALASTTALVNGSTYYASQTVSGCQSASRLAVAVTIGNPAAPTGSANQSFCAINNPTVANLTATGTAIQWYTTSTGGSALASTTALVNGSTYYASQTVSGCQSAGRLAVAVTIGNPAAPTGSANQSFCAINNPTVANLSATGTAIQWYTTSTGGSALASTTALVNGSTYYASQTVSGCQSVSRLAVNVTISNGATADAGPASSNSCAGFPFTLNATATNYSSLLWTSSGDGSFDSNSIEDATYSPGVNDLNNGSVTLTLRALGINPCPDATDLITLTFLLDSDGDGVCNDIDLDDDNDGIPDTVEGTIDSDMDGVPNNLDLDSDNDGIYDLVEAGHIGADVDNNGRIDGPMASFGANGLSESVETTPDSGVLNYSVADSDSDSLIDSLELDSDNDGCYDVLEAGYADPDSNGLLGTGN